MKEKFDDENRRLIIKDHTEFLQVEHKKLYSEFPADEIFPIENIQFACINNNYKILKFYNNTTLIGTAFLAILKKSKYLVINYLYIEKEYRGKGYGSQIVNKIKQKFSDYNGIIIEVELSENENPMDNKNKRLRFYKKLKFNSINYNYKILQTEKNAYQDMLLQICNLKNSEDYNYTYNELIDILDEYYKIIFDSDYKSQYQLLN